jgi:hypothetical protein
MAVARRLGHCSSENGKALYGSGLVWADLIGKTWDDYYLQFRMNSQSSAVMHANIRLLGTVRYFIGLSRNQSYLPGRMTKYHPLMNWLRDEELALVGS